MPVDIAAWKQRQEQVRRQVRLEPLPRLPRFVAGVDCAFSADRRFVLCVAVGWDRKSDAVVDQSQVIVPGDVPYVPGFLSFREGPAVKEAIGKLRHPFEAVLFDAHGLAHPRRCGLAAHMSVELDVVGVGVAKSRLIGEHETPGEARGEWVPLEDQGQAIGSVLRTREAVRPVYVSIGHRITLASARRLVLACCTRYRLPEPTRLADRAVARLKREAGR